MAVAAIVFTASLAALFPTDALVRRALSRAAESGWPAVVFERAAFRPGGLVLDGVTLRDPTGAPRLAARRIRLRPSLRGLLRDGSGRPWTIEAEVCDGRGVASVAGDGRATDVTLSWEDADLTVCPPLEIAGGALAGRARGSARLRLDPAAPPAGTGDVELRAAVWRGRGLLARLHASSASLRWRLSDGRLTLEAFDLRGPEVLATGSGEVRLAEPLPASDLDLELTLAWGAGGPARHVSVAGTVAAPKVVAP
jgi:type II secretion system protein N